jgi:hypothetical protein
MWTNKAKETKRMFRVIDPNENTIETKTLVQIFRDQFDNEELIAELSVMEPGDDYFDDENQIMYVSIPSFLSTKLKLSQDEDPFETI